MDLRTALKLQQLRKEKGISQEALAEELKVSRQAVSKWERGEASPDTDNLICLAKLYKISLDNLLEIENGNKTENNSNNIKKGNVSNLRVGKLIHAITPPLSILVFCLLGSIWGLWHPAWLVFFSIPMVSTLVVAIKTQNFSAFAYPILILTIYLFLGFVWGLWHPAWVMFLTIPIYYSISSFFARKKLNKKAMQKCQNIDDIK